MGFFPSSSLGSSVHRSGHIAHCGKCGLSKGCFSPRMPPTGEGLHRILFVAEAPGEEEDKQGVQLIGKSGQLLRKILRGLGKNLDDYRKTNTIICRPPDNKMDDAYIEACRPNLLKTIRAEKPNVIVLLGMSAVRSLVAPEWRKDVGELGRWVGWRIPSPAHNAWLCPTYHPSYLLRMDEDELLVKLTTEHLKAAFRLETKPPAFLPIKDLQAQVEIVMEPAEVRRRLRDLAGKEGELAFDYETTGLKPERKEHRIVSCSFCLNGEGTWAGMMDERSLRLLSPVLQSPRLAKIASNIKFEERWSRAKLGHGVANWGWDTMLASHVLDNRKDITSIKFQSYIHLGVADYNSAVEPFLESPTANGFNRIDELAPKDLLLYNGLDSLLEYKVAVMQRRPRLWTDVP